METSKNNQKLFGFGNTKLPKTTIIFNMSSSTHCPSRKMGQCKVCKYCYAYKAERLYPQVLPFRTRQNEYWKSHTAYEIVQDMFAIINRKRIKPKLFRFNESGDFANQTDIKKLSYIALALSVKYGIKTYGYTARKDLNFSGVSFFVKSSGNQNDTVNNGNTIIIEKNEALPKNYSLCPGDCRICTMCSSSKKINIAFRKH